MLIAGCIHGPAAVFAQGLDLSGRVTDPNGGAVPGAAITLLKQTTPIRFATTGAAGSFQLEDLSVGTHTLKISAPGFEPWQELLHVSEDFRVADIQLAPARLRSEITVTASRGDVEETFGAAPVITSRTRAELLRRPAPTLGHGLESSPGIMVQQTGDSQSSLFLRGLTGYHVLHLIDGIRLNNSTHRSGPNQYLAFVDPADVESVEAILGPNSSQYGSDDRY